MEDLIRLWQTSEKRISGTNSVSWVLSTIQRQRLVAFNLNGNANKWYRSEFSEDMLITTWEEFIRRLNLQYISSPARAGKEVELLSLKKGDMMVFEYEDMSISFISPTTCFSLRSGRLEY